MKTVIFLGLFSLISYGRASPYRRKADFRHFSSRIGESKDVFIALNHDKKTGRAEKVCMIDGISYRDGDAVPTSNQCEFCVCRPPGFACSLLQCPPPRNKACRVLQKSGACCPDYQCDCEKDGKIYRSGQKIIDPKNPCDVCFCQGGDLLCSKIHCFIRSDCKGINVPGRCCPSYDHCDVKQTGLTRPRPTNVSSFVTHQSFFPTAATSSLSELPSSTTEVSSSQKEQEKDDTSLEESSSKYDSQENELDNDVEDGEVPVKVESLIRPLYSKSPEVSLVEDDKENESAESSETSVIGSEELKPEQPSGIEANSEVPIEIKIPFEAQVGTELAEQLVTSSGGASVFTQLNNDPTTTILSLTEVHSELQEDRDKIGDKELEKFPQLQTESPLPSDFLHIEEQSYEENQADEDFDKLVNHAAQTSSNLTENVTNEQTTDEEALKEMNEVDTTTKSDVQFDSLGDGFIDLEKEGVDKVEDPLVNNIDGLGQEFATNQESPGDVTEVMTVVSDNGDVTEKMYYDSFYDYPPNIALTYVPLGDTDAYDYTTLASANEKDTTATLEGSGGSVQESFSENVDENHLDEAMTGTELESGVGLLQDDSSNSLLEGEKASGLPFTSFYDIPGHYPTTWRPFPVADAILNEVEDLTGVHLGMTEGSGYIAANIASNTNADEVDSTDAYPHTDFPVQILDHTTDGSFSNQDSPDGTIADGNQELGSVIEYVGDEKHTTDIDYISDEGLFNLQAVTLVADMPVSADSEQSFTPRPYTDAVEVETVDVVKIEVNDAGTVEGSGDEVIQHDFKAITMSAVEDLFEDATTAFHEKTLSEVHTMQQEESEESSGDLKEAVNFEDSTDEDITASYFEALLSETGVTENVLDADSDSKIQNSSSIAESMDGEDAGSSEIDIGADVVEASFVEGSEGAVNTQLKPDDNLGIEVEVGVDSLENSEIQNVPNPSAVETDALDAVEVEVDADITEDPVHLSTDEPSSITETIVIDAVEVEVDADVTEDPVQLSTDEPPSIAETLAIDAVEVEVDADVTEDPVQMSTDEPSSIAEAIATDAVEVEVDADVTEDPVQISTDEPSSVAETIAIDAVEVEVDADVTEDPVQMSTDEPSSIAETIAIDAVEVEVDADVTEDPVQISTDEPSSIAETIAIDAVEVEVDADVTENPVQLSTDQPSSIAEIIVIDAVEVEVDGDITEDPVQLSIDEPSPVAETIAIDAVEVEVDADVTEDPVQLSTYQPFVIAEIQAAQVELDTEGANLNQVTEEGQKEPTVTDLPVHTLQAVEIEIEPLKISTDSEQINEPTNEVQKEDNFPGTEAVTTAEALTTTKNQTSSNDGSVGGIKLQFNRLNSIHARNGTAHLSDNVHRRHNIKSQIVSRQNEQKVTKPLTKLEKSSGDLPVMLQELDVLLNSGDALPQSFD